MRKLVSAVLYLTLGFLAVACSGGGGGDSTPPPASGVDLISTYFAASSVGTAGSTITVSDTAYNQGGTASGAFYVGLYLSTNSTISTSDTLIAYRYVSSGLGSGQSSSSSGAVTLPSTIPAGAYYLGVIVDDQLQVVESDETNNGSAASAITIYNTTALPDLVIQNFTAPSTATRGYTATIAFTVKNQGSATASASRAGVYLSSNNVISTGDTLIGYGSTSSLASGATQNFSGLYINSGVPTGTWYIGILADDQGAVSESSESNNVSSVRTITIY